mmetsp:Transcript_38625/g.98633  ORF Transcript_38625/g.98633 Transcript_38625/m.98633 type:complete len:614 (+) Transcript_38625:62-1903(+)
MGSEGEPASDSSPVHWAPLALATLVVLHLCSSCWRGVFFRGVASLSHWVRRRRQEKSEEREIIHRLVQDQIAARRLNLMRITVTAVACIKAVAAVIGIMRFLVMGSAGRSVNEQAIFVAIYATLIIFDSGVCMRSQRGCDLVYATLMLLSLALNSPASGNSRTVLLLSTKPLDVITLVISVAYLKPQITIASNIAYTCFSVYVYSALESYAHADDEAAFGWSSLWALGMKVTMIILVQHVIAEGIRGEIEAKQERSYRTALMSLLRSMCDAVVELDCQRRIVDHASALSHLLLHGPGKSLRGLTLKDFMPEEQDQQRFDNSLEDPNTPMLHVVLRDCLGNRIRMHMFHIAFRSSDDTQHHFVGLTEATDPFTASYNESPGVVQPGDASSSLIPATSVPDMPHQVEQTEACEVGVAQASSKTFASSRSDPSLVGNEMQVDVSVQSGLPITFASQRFKRKYGEAVQDALFSDWLVDANRFEQWLASRANAIYDGQRMPYVEDFGQLVVQPRDPSARGGLCRAGPRQITVMFLEPSRPRETYRVSIRIGPRQALASSSHSGTSPHCSRESLPGSASPQLVEGNPSTRELDSGVGRSSGSALCMGAAGTRANSVLAL